MTAPSTRPGLVQPWRLDSGDTLYLEHDVFHALVDQAACSRIRAALARGVGAHWIGGGVVRPSARVEGEASDAACVLPPGRYAAFTGAGLPAWGTVGDAGTAAPLPSAPDGAYAVVGLRANGPGERGAVRLVAQALPVSAAWMLGHVCVAVLRREDGAWHQMDWEPATIDIAATDDLAETLATWRESAPTSWRDLTALARRLEDASDALDVDSWRPVARELARAAMALRDCTSRIDQWMAVVGAVACAERVLERSTPVELTWPAWSVEDIGPVAAHFDAPLDELVAALAQNAGAVVHAAEGREFAFRPPAVQWWARLRPQRDALVLPMLELPGRSLGAPRGVRVDALGRFDGSQGCWVLDVPDRTTSADRAFVMLIPDAAPDRVSVSLSVALRARDSRDALGTMTRSVDVGGGCFWELVALGDEVAPPHGPRPSAGLSLVVWQTAEVPPLAACLLLCGI